MLHEVLWFLVPRVRFPLPVFICIFLRFCQSSFEKWQHRSFFIAKRNLVIFSSNTFVFGTSSKFAVLNYLKLVVTLAFTVVLLVWLLAKRWYSKLFFVLLVCLCLCLNTFGKNGVVLWFITWFITCNFILASNISC